MKSTKVVCTIGPSSQNENRVRELADAGMNIARMNFSHGTHEYHDKTLKILARVRETLENPLGILLDLQGPKVRTGKLVKETVVLKKGDTIELTTLDVVGDWNILSVNYDRLPREVKGGERILLDDGSIELEVIDASEESIFCRILNGGTIRSYRGVNLPDTSLGIPSLTEKDREDLAFGLEREVDFFALSFVRRAADIGELREIMDKRGRVLPIVAKIEKPEAIRNIDEIIDAADAIMVARGDLGAETSPQDVPIFQKMIIGKCNRAGKPVITATQMLESMVGNPHPTRAEAADVANAIYDGTDAVMLSGETAIGQYPVQAARIMAEIANRVEGNRDTGTESLGRVRPQPTPGEMSVAEIMSLSATTIADLLDIRCIIGFTLTGRTAALTSKYRPRVPIIAMSPHEEVLRRLTVFWGVHGVVIDHVSSTEDLLDRAEEILVGKGLCSEGDQVLFIGGVPVLAGVQTNMLKVHRLKLGERNI
jgi:pyruvate kinase